MTINRTKVKPNFYVEIDGVDVSDFIVQQGNFNPTSKNKISRGRFVIDNNVGITIRKYQEVGFWVEFDNKYKRFGGVISSVLDNAAQFRTVIDVRGFAWLFYQTDFTGIFRDDSSKGNRKTIITDIITEKFPNITWDDTSFPDIDSSFDIIYKQYNLQKPGDIIDALIQPLNRDWWVDDTGKFFCKTRVYTEVNQPVTLNVNTFGLPTIDINNNYANIVKVTGAKFEKYITKTFSGTGSTDEFELDFNPDGSSDVEYDSGDLITTTMEGNENYDDSTEYDAYFKVSDRKFKFNGNTTIGTDNIIVKTKVFDQIREEVPKASEIDRIGFEVVKKIKNEDIDTQEEAYLVASTYLDNFAKDLAIYFIGVNISNDDQLRDWTIGNSVPLDVGNGSEYENIIEEIWNFDKSTQGLVLQLRFVDFPRTDSDVINELLNRIRVQDSVIDKSSTNITRYFYAGSVIVIEQRNVAIELQADDDRFQMQSINQDKRSWMSKTGTLPSGLGGGSAHIMKRGAYTTTPYMFMSINEDNKFIENFYDSFFIDSCTGEQVGDTFVLDNGETLISKKMYKESGRVVDGSSINFTELNGTITGTLTQEIEIDSSGFHLVNGGTLNGLTGEYIRYKITNSTGFQAILTDLQIDYLPRTL